MSQRKCCQLFSKPTLSVLILDYDIIVGNSYDKLEVILTCTIELRHFVQWFSFLNAFQVDMIYIEYSNIFIPISKLLFQHFHTFTSSINACSHLRYSESPFRIWMQIVKLTFAIRLNILCQDRDQGPPKIISLISGPLKPGVMKTHNKIITLFGQ